MNKQFVIMQLAYPEKKKKKHQQSPTYTNNVYEQ